MPASPRRTLSPLPNPKSQIPNPRSQPSPPRPIRHPLIRCPWIRASSENPTPSSLLSSLSSRLVSCQSANYFPFPDLASPSRGVDAKKEKINGLKLVYLSPLARFLFPFPFPPLPSSSASYSFVCSLALLFHRAGSFSRFFSPSSPWVSTSVFLFPLPSPPSAHT